MDTPDWIALGALVVAIGTALFSWMQVSSARQQARAAAAQVASAERQARATEEQLSILREDSVRAGAPTFTVVQEPSTSQALLFGEMMSRPEGPAGLDSVTLRATGRHVVGVRLTRPPGRQQSVTIPGLQVGKSFRPGIQFDAAIEPFERRHCLLIIDSRNEKGSWSQTKDCIFEIDPEDVVDRRTPPSGHTDDEQ